MMPGRERIRPRTGARWRRTEGATATEASRLWWWKRCRCEEGPQPHEVDCDVEVGVEVEVKVGADDESADDSGRVRGLDAVDENPNVCWQAWGPLRAIETAVVRAAAVSKGGEFANVREDGNASGWCR